MNHVMTPVQPPSGKPSPNISTYFITPKALLFLRQCDRLTSERSISFQNSDLCCWYSFHSTINMQVRIETISGTCEYRFRSYLPRKVTITDASACKHHGGGQKGHGEARRTKPTMRVPTEIVWIRKMEIW
jgi:hypothetical protein